MIGTVSKDWSTVDFLLFFLLLVVFVKSRICIKSPCLVSRSNFPPRSSITWHLATTLVNQTLEVFAFEIYYQLEFWVQYLLGFLWLAVFTQDERLLGCIKAWVLGYLICIYKKLNSLTFNIFLITNFNETLQVGAFLNIKKKFGNRVKNLCRLGFVHTHFWQLSVASHLW